MATPISELFVSVTADVTGAINGLNALGNKLNSTTSQFRQAAPAALLLAGAGAAIGAGFVSSIKTASDFDKQMAAVRANMSPAEVLKFGGAVRELAIALGEDTAFNAKQAAGGIEELLKAGIPAEAILGGAGKAAIDLAAATGTPVANAGTIAAAAMNAFGASVTDLPGIVNTLAGVSVTTAADMNDMAQGISDVGNVAHGFGLSFTDAATAIGIFRDQGLSGQTAGTALKTMLVGLQPQTAKEIALFKKLGFTTDETANAFFDAHGNIKDLASVAGVLQHGLQGMTAAQRQATLVQLFGTQGFQAANALYATGADGVRKYTAEIAKIDAATVAAERLNSLSGDVEKLSGAIQTAQIRIGDIFTPTLRKLAQRATELVKVFTALSPQQQRLIVLFTAGAGVVASLLGGFVLLAPAIVALGPAFGALGGVLAGLSVPFVLLAGAAALLVLAWRRDLGGIQEIAKSAFDALPGLLDTVRTDVAKLSDLWESRLMPALRPVGDFVRDKLVPAFLDLVAPLKNITDDVDRLSVQFDKANGFLREHGAQIAIIGGAIGGAVTGFLLFQQTMSTINGILTIGKGLITAFQLAFGLLTLAMAANPFLLAAVAIGAIVGALIVAYQTNEDFRNSVDALLANLGPLGDALGNAFSALGSFVDEHGPAVLAFLQNLGGVALAELGRQGASLQPFIAALGNFFSALGNFVSAVAERAGPALQGFFQNVLVPGFEALGEALRPLLPLVQPILDFLASLNLQLPTIGDALKPFTVLLDLWAKALDAIASAIRTMPALPDWLTPNSGANVFGNRPGGTAATGPQVTPTAFSFGGAGAGGGGGNVIITGPINISGGVELEEFAQSIAAAVRSSAGRVNAPPDNSGNPQLVPSFA